MAGERSNAQWFPVLYGESAQFKVDATPSGNAGAIARVLFTLDTFPWLLYGVRFEVSYELPALFLAEPENWPFKQFMREGGIDDDFSVTIRAAQQSITGGNPVHVRNVQGALGINKHPLPLPYPFRGGNKIEIECRRLSSYPVIEVADLQVVLTPTVHVALELARGVQQVADGVSSPPPPPSTGFPT